MRIAICDDDSVFSDSIYKHLTNLSDNYEEECKFSIVENANELIELCKTTKIDAVFLDIDMPELDGFKTAKELSKIRENIILVFVSNKEHLVYSSYEYNPLWFVPKSQLNFLDTALDKVITTYISMEKECSIIPITMENQIVEINLKQTAYFINTDHYVKIVNKDKTTSFSYRCKLDDVEKQLGKFDFVRVHKRFLVNIRMVKMIENSKCVLNNDETISISRAKMSEVKQAFQSYLRSIR